MHIVQPEGIGLELPHRSREHVPIASFDRVVPLRELRLGGCIEHVADRGQRLGIVAVIVPRCRPGTAGVFPLGLRGQSVRLALLLAQPLAKLHRVVPTHVHHGVLVGLLETRVPPGILLVEAELLLVGVPAPGPRLLSLLRVRLVACISDELPKLPPRDVVSTQVERLRDPHAVLGMLDLEEVRGQKILAVGLFEEGSRGLRRLATTHLELACRDERELHADGVGDLLLNTRHGDRLCALSVRPRVAAFVSWRPFLLRGRRRSKEHWQRANQRRRRDEAQQVARGERRAGSAGRHEHRQPLPPERAELRVSPGVERRGPGTVRVGHGKAPFGKVSMVSVMLPDPIRLAAC